MEPIIVTAFWDVGRGNECLIPRSNEKYYKEFEMWARIKNFLFIYTDEKSADIIYRIRASYNLQDKTKVIVTKNVFDIEKEIYDKLVQIEKLDTNFKFLKDAMSNRAKFDYAWFMKYWCINDAASHLSQDDLIVWMDFGFNHLNVCYADMSQFDFVYNCEADINKIHIFSLVDIHPYDNKSLLGNVMLQNDVLMGVFHIVPVKYANELWNLIKQAMLSLINLRVLDDDQMLLLMAYYYKPDIFSIHVSDWFLPLKETGAYHLKTFEDIKKKRKINIIKAFNKKIHFLLSKIKFFCRLNGSINEYFGRNF